MDPALLLPALLHPQAERISRVHTAAQPLGHAWWAGLVASLLPLSALAVATPFAAAVPAPAGLGGSLPPTMLPLPNSPTPEPAQPAQVQEITPGPSSTAPARTPLTGLVTIESDLQKADNNTGVITASGNVRIVYRDRGVVATARQAQYFSREGRVVLSGDVEVVQEGGNRLLADRVVYLVESERLVAQPAPGQQVTSRIRIPPPQPAQVPPPQPLQLPPPADPALVQPSPRSETRVLP